jgi:hypothetical protein
VTAGRYQLQAAVDPDDEIAESDDSNNLSALAGQTVAADAHADLGVSIGPGPLTLPASAVSGDGTRFEISATIRNSGNVAVPRKTAIRVDVLAMPAGGGTGTAVASFTAQRTAGLKPGRSARQRLRFELPRGLAGDQYVFAAEVDPDNDVGEPYDEQERPLTRENNTAFTAAEREVDVAEGFFELDASFTEYQLPAQAVARQQVPGTVALTMTNRGTLPFPQGQSVATRLVARPPETDGSQDVVIAELPPRDVGRLAPGGTAQVALAFALPDALGAGQYHVFAVADSAEALPERDEDNLTAAPRSLVLEEPFIDLVARVDGSKLPATVVKGDRTPLPLPVTVVNLGNAAVPAGTVVDLEVFSNRIERGFHTQEVREPKALSLGAFPFDVGGLAAGAQRVTEYTTALRDEISPNFEYSLTVTVDTTNLVAESDEGNNGAESNVLYSGRDPLDFVTAGQSMWGAGSGAILDSGRNFVGKSFSTDKVLKQMNVGLANGELYAHAAGRVGADFRAVLDTGSVDVEYKSAADVKVVDFGRDVFTVSTGAAGDTTGYLNTRSPNIDVESNVIFDFDADVGVRGFAPFEGNYDHSVRVADIHTALELLKLTNSGLRVLGIPVLENADGPFSVEVELGIDGVTRKPSLAIKPARDLPHPHISPDVEIKEPDAPKKPKKPHSLNPLKNIELSFSAGDATLSVPDIALSEDTWRQGVGGPTIRATGLADLAKFQLDLDFLAVTLATLASGVAQPGALGATFQVDPLFELELDALDADFGPVFSIRQDFTFDARPTVTFLFSAPVNLVDSTRLDDPPIATGLTQHTVPLGSTFDFKPVNPAADLQVRTVYNMGGNLHNLTDLTVRPQLELDVLKIAGKFLFVDLGSYAAYQFTHKGNETPLATLFERDFQLGGFATEPGRTIDLDVADRKSAVVMVLAPPPQSAAPGGATGTPARLSANREGRLAPGETSMYPGAASRPTSFSSGVEASVISDLVRSDGDKLFG